MADVPGVPATTQEEGERHRKSAGLLVHRLTHRKRALLEQTLDKIMEKAGTGGDRDPVAALARQYFEDPKAWLSWLNNLLPQDQTQVTNVSNINALFLQATQLANGHTAGGRVIDAGASRVQEDASDW